MAFANEISGSREGDERGTTGYVASRTFQVQLDAAGDDPIATLISEDEDLRMGVTHPEEGFTDGLFVSGYRKSQQQDLTLWLVDVLYRSPFVVSPTEWTMEVDLAVQTEQMAKDLEQKLVGPRAFRTPKAGQPEVPGRPEVPGEIATHYATSADVDKIPLFLPHDTFGVPLVRPQPIDRYAPVSRLVLSRTVPYITGNDWKLADALHVKMNKETDFYGAARGHVLFLGMRAASVAESSGVETSTGQQWRVELSYLKSRIPWSPVPKFDTYRAPEADYESFVYAEDVDVASGGVAASIRPTGPIEPVTPPNVQPAEDPVTPNAPAIFQNFHVYNYGYLSDLLVALGGRTWNISNP